MIQPPIEILKSLWSRRDDGRWGITDMKSLTLKPKQDHKPDYFAIDSQIELMTNSPAGMNLHQVLASFGTTEFLMKQSIMPVVAWRNGDESIRAIGTASVISCTGYILTAAHVVMDPFESGYGAKRRGDGLEYAEALNFGVFIPLSPATGVRGVIFAPFEKLWFWGRWKDSLLFHEPPRFEFATDVAVCKIPALPNESAHQPLNMAVNPFKKEEAAYSIGYAKMADIPVNYKDDTMSFGGFSADLYVSIGAVSEVFPMNSTERNAPLMPGPCFEFRANIPGKMSGAPVFGGGGAVIRGVVSRSWQDGRDASGAMLGPVMDLPLNEQQTHERTLRSLMEQGNEGIAKVHGMGL